MITFHMNILDLNSLSLISDELTYLLPPETIQQKKVGIFERRS